MDGQQELHSYVEDQKRCDPKPLDCEIAVFILSGLMDAPTKPRTIVNASADHQRPRKGKQVINSILITVFRRR